MQLGLAIHKANRIHVGCSAVRSLGSYLRLHTV